MATHYASLSRNGRAFRAELHVNGSTCAECVMLANDMGSTVIHEAQFPLSNLGAASRDEYTRVMLSSIADQFFRK